MTRFRSFIVSSLFFVTVFVQAAPVQVNISAPTYAGERVLLYRYLDAFTQRQQLIAEARLDAKGNAVLNADVTGTTKGMVRVGLVSSDLFLRAGTYHMEMPAPDATKARSVNGTTHVDLIFHDLDRVDVNSLTSDLNDKLDAFVAEDLATDQAAGMQAVDLVRKGEGTLQRDTLKRPATLFITPSWSTARVDTFERKLRRYYAEVNDPWFSSDLEYGIAGLRFGPSANDRELFERYLKGKPVLYDVPEYTRFISSFFADHFMRFPFRSNTDALLRAIREAQADSLKSLLRKNDFLKDDARLCELVMLTELYANYWGSIFDRKGIERLLQHASTSSAFVEHRVIATDMLWDLTAMRPGSMIPSLTLLDEKGDSTALDLLLTGPVCIVITAGWCTYCEQQMSALEKLHADYGENVHFIGISLDRTQKDLTNYLKAHPGRQWTWLQAGDDPSVMEQLRIRSIPSFLLLNDTVLAQSPAPMPSEGLAAVLYKIKVQAEQEQRITPDRGVPPPKR